MTSNTFSPPGDVGVRCTAWVELTRFTGLNADCYSITTEGTCLEPQICDGDKVFVDPNRMPEVGEFAVFWPRDGRRPSVKRLVVALSSARSPYPELVPLVVVEQLNPPKQYFCGRG